jgi:hypothetical protein
MVNHETPPYCRTCEDFHEESTCPVFCQINEQRLPETNNYASHSRRSDYINNVNKPHPISKEKWEQFKETDNVTKLYGEKTTPEQILEMAKFKGVTYQRKRNDHAVKSYKNLPKTNTPPATDLDVDLGSWIKHAKVLVHVSELIKIPSQKDRLLKAIEDPTGRNLEKFKEKIINNPREYNEDVPVILHSMDWTREDHPPFFVSLMVNNMLLHNCMFDFGPSSNIITKKVMQQLNLNVTRPYHNVCAMDSMEINNVGIILNLRVRLAAHQDITVVMDLLVIDVPDAWGMLMSRKWAATLGGHIQMDLTCATIPALDNTLVKLYREQ